MSDTLKVQGISITFKEQPSPVKQSEKSVSNPNSIHTVQNPIEIPKAVDKRYELSWYEIGETAKKSAINFVKGMFCDENGFSLKRTALTVGTIAGLTLAAPIAATLGASAAVVGVVAGTSKLAGLGLAGYMAYNGGKNIINGTQKYYESKTEEEAKANMTQAMDGAVEFATALPAFLFIKGGANKGKKIASKKAETKPTESKPVNEPKVETTKTETPKVSDPKSVEQPPVTETVQVFKELSIYKESDFNVSITNNGHRQALGNNKVVPDLRTHLNGAKDGYAVVYMPDKNVTAVVIEVAGRGGDNWTLMINGKVPDVKIAEFVEYCNKNSITKIDRQLYMDFFNGKLSNTKPVEVPNSEVTKTEPQKVEQKTTEQKSEPAKTESQPAIDYNKSVRSELKKKSDGSTIEVFYNTEGDMVKSITRDNTGKIEYTSIYEYNASGENVKYIWQSSTGSICETFYNKGTEIKKVWKWDDGQVDEFYPKSNDVYEGVRTYPDGKKVKIREENNSTQELGPVE